MPHELITKARQYANAGKMDDAVAMYKDALKSAPENALAAECHGVIGGWHFHQARYDKALEHFQICAGIIEPNPALEFDLGQTFELLGRHESALTCYLKALHLMPGNTRYYLYAADMLHTLGREEDALEVWSLAADKDPMVRNAEHHPNADASLIEKSRRADSALRKHFAQLHRDTVGSSEKLSRVRNGLWPQTHDQEFQFSNELQKPHIFYMPDLPQEAVFRDLSWAPEIEPYTDEIREEYLQAARSVHGVPYVDASAAMGPEWSHLKGKEVWRSIHLYQEGKRNDEYAKLFPKTLEAIEKAPLVKMNGVPLEVFFSVLEPGTHIPPHYGLANCRMTTHLPLIIPLNCGIRVANETYGWNKGKILAFDDSYIHEAWNSSTEKRVVLIFEAWAPDLTIAEQDAISSSYAARAKWLESRKVPNA